tara:strand:+ start:23139 stop:24515 length:1377 start_codon:yes stop_codon:yes gene_type:complete
MHESHHVVAPSYLDMTAQEITNDVLKRHHSPGNQFWTIAMILGGLFVVGLVGLFMLIADGFDNKSAWGYYAATFGYVFSLSQTAVLVSVALRMAKSHWRRPLARISEMFAIVGVYSFAMLLPLLWVLPSIEGRRSLWFEWPGNTPHIWDTMALGSLVICGLAILYFASLPDLVTDKEVSGKSDEDVSYHPLIPHWFGAPKHWQLQKIVLGLLGGFYFLMLIIVHMLISVDFAMALIPGWKDAIFPAFHAINGIQASIALIIVTMFILRSRSSLGKYLELEQFWALSKILLATCLLWFYFWWSSFFTYWYGRMPAEIGVLKYIMFETYSTVFLLAFTMCFVIPFLILVVNVVRKTIWGPTLAASVILIGTFFNQVRYYVAGFSVEDHTLHVLENLPDFTAPGPIDFMVVVGGISGAVLTYMLGTRIFPIISIWEIKEGLMLQRVRKFMKRDIRVLAKPE